jgi:type IV pilus assembly protein PilA
MYQHSRSDDGFTLVELMVVVLIIAILIAIAIPTFMGARTRAQDRSAQSNLRNALTAAKVYYSDSNSQDYAFGVPDLQDVHANLAFVPGNAPAMNEVGFLTIANSDGRADQAVVFIAQSVSGTWFCLLDEASGSRAGTFYGEAPLPGTGADLDTIAECVGGWN